MKTELLKMKGNLIIEATISIDEVLHLVQNKFVKCSASLNNSAWNITQPKDRCPICFPKNINPIQLKLF